jgi:hypothetical protein
MAADRDVEFDIIATDKSARATRTAARNFSDLKKRVDSSTKSNDRWSKATVNVAKKAAVMGKAVAKAGGTLASLGSAGGAAALGLLAGAKAAVVVGKALAGLAPLAAFIPSLLASVGLIAGTLKLAGPGLVRAVEPVTRAFYDADGNATKLTKHIQDLASKGVQPLAREFVRVNLPSIAAGMEGVARATNHVITDVGKWLNSIEGQKLIRDITTATATASEKLAPHISAAAIALGRLAGRAGDKAITGLGDLIGRILDKFTAWANSKTVDDINGALSQLSGYGARLREMFSAVRDIGGWLVANEGAVRAFTTTLGVLGVVLSAATGNWVGAAIGAFALLVTNWDTTKGVFSSAAKWWSNTWNGIKNDPAIRDLVAAIQTHFQKIAPVVQAAFASFRTDVLPKLIELKDTIFRDVIPAVTAFINAVSPIAVLFAQKILPVVSSVFSNLVAIISGALKVLSGLLNIFTGTLTLDWSKAWNGVLQIFRGVAQAITASSSALWSGLKSQWGSAVSSITAILSGWKAKIVGVFNGAGSWLAGVGRAIVDGLVSGILGAAGRITSAVGSLVAKAKAAVPAVLRGALGFSGDTGSWAPAQFAAQFAGGPGFAAAGPGGGSRVGGPTPVDVTSNVQVYLDGAPFAAMVTASEKRTAWRNKVGRR